jgi:hypothetical protein
LQSCWVIFIPWKWDAAPYKHYKHCFSTGSMGYLIFGETGWVIVCATTEVPKQASGPKMSEVLDQLSMKATCCSLSACGAWNMFSGTWCSAFLQCFLVEEPN